MAGAQRGWPQFMLRVPPDMKRWLEAQAERNFSSQNSEILRCIQERMDRTAAIEARRKSATGDGLKPQAPAAVPNNAALPGGIIINQAMELPR
jgi:hypothetical protein